MNASDVLSIVAKFLDSFQVRAVFGLIVLDVLLGVASALRRGAFDVRRLADFYATNVAPYIIGYGAFYVVTYAIFPKDFTAIPDGLVTVAWGVLVGNLVGSILENVSELYKKQSDLARRLNLALLLSLPFLFAAGFAPGVASADADSSPPFADAETACSFCTVQNPPADSATFPQTEEYCLAAAVHTEAASQSVAAKAAIARWILVRAIERQQTVCQSLRSDRAVLAAHAKEGTWAHAVFHNGDLLRRQRGAESWLIALSVYDAAGAGGEVYKHFDSCDSQARWTDFYERLRLAEGDSVCVWR